MLIKSLRVTNFKSFNDIYIKLNRFNVLIGANASGKSNFVSIFKFLKDIAESGLENAISMQGGLEYLQNMKIGKSKNLILEVRIDPEKKHLLSVFLKNKKNKKVINIILYDIVYKLSIEFCKDYLEYKVAEEKLLIKCKFNIIKNTDKVDVIHEIIKINENKLQDGNVELIISDGNIKYNATPKELSDIYFSFREAISEKESLLRKKAVSPFISIFNTILSKISTYSIDPRPSKNPVYSGKIELAPDGSNLAIVLKDILKEEKKQETLIDLIKDLLPFIEDISTKKIGESIITNLKETYFERFLPAFLISDGTINILALIIILYFEKKNFIIIEEPERNIHPYLISKIVDMMKDVSERLDKQIIITTHNPEIVKYADIDDILLIYRDNDGFSQISRPSEKEEIKQFLKNKIGLDELYVQNLLEW